MRPTLLTIAVTLCLVSSAGRAPRRAASTPSDGSLLSAILDAEDHRILGDKAILRSLGHGSAKVARAAALAAGRVRDPAAAEDLGRLLNRKDRDRKIWAAFSLGLIGNDYSLKLLTQHLPMQKDPQVIGALLQAAGHAGGESTLATISTYALSPDASPVETEAACRAIGILWTGDSEKWGLPPDLLSGLAKLAAGRDPVALSAAFALSRFKGAPAALPLKAILEALARATTPGTRGFLVRALAKVPSLEVGAVLAQEMTSATAVDSQRIEAAKGLAAQEPSPAVLAALRRGLTENHSHLVFQTLETLFNLSTAAEKAADAVEAVYLNSTSPWLKGGALKTLASVTPKAARPRVLEALASPDPMVREAAVGALALTGSSEDLEKLVGYVNGSDPRLSASAVEALSLMPEDRLPGQARTALRTVIAQGDTAVVTLVAQVAERFRWKDFGGPLGASYRLLRSADQIEAKVAVLNALGAVGDHSLLDVLETGIQDGERLVASAAVAALKSITGRDESARIPPNSRVTAKTPGWGEAQAAAGATVTFKTTRGEIQLKMSTQAPLTAYRFVTLARKGFYDGKTFHRVVPGFVVQGGDPRGDGYGGPGFLIRDEPSPAAHERGTVGIATAGPDTGGCQFFINLGPNLHLDGRYTLFARVVSGVDVADRLEVGDKILSTRIR